MPSDIDWSALSDALDHYSPPVDVAMSVVAPDGAHWQHQGDRPVPSASTVKLAVMVTVYRLIDAGQLDLEQRHRLEETDRTGGSGVLQHLSPGLEPTLGDLLYLMMSISDNPATNILTALVGFPAVNAVMRELGMTRSVYARPMRGRLAIAGEQENLATASDYTRLLRSLFTHEAASGTACAAMLDLLRLQQNHKRIGRHVPIDPGFRWGSKTGTNRGLVNDVGYVTGPAGTALMAVFCRGVSDEASGEAIISELARRALEVTGVLPRPQR